MTIEERKIFGLNCSLGSYLLISSSTLALVTVSDPAFLVSLLNVLVALFGILAVDYNSNRCAAIIGGIAGLIATFFNVIVMQRDIDVINQVDQPLYLLDETTHEYYMNKSYYPLIIALAFRVVLAVEGCFVTLLVLWKAVHPKEKEIQSEKLVEYV